MDRFELVLMRLRVNLKQYEVAQLLGVPPTIICDLESGRRPITPEIEKRIREDILNRKAISGKLASAQKES